jgi:DHA1 family bicyclomycin/chloramphenicol resistance-like MFS transporter
MACRGGAARERCGMTRQGRLLTLVLGALTAFGPMSIDMYLPSLPALARALQTDPASAQMTLAAFFIGMALGQVLYGPLADRFGRKPPLYAGIVLYVLASIWCALAPDIRMLIAARFIQALGACSGMVIARAVVRDLFETQDAARMFSVLMLVMGVAPILAPLAGAQLLVVLGWQSIFWALAGFGVLCLIASAAWLPETRAPGPVSLTLAGALREYRALLADRGFLGYALSGGLAFAGMFAYITGSPFVFIDLYGVPAQHYGWLFGSNALGLIIASQINRRLLRRRPASEVMRMASAVNFAFAVLLFGLVTSGATGGLVGVIVPLFGFIASLGFIFPNSAALAMAPQGARAGSAAALLGTLQFGLATLASALVGALGDATARPMAGVILLGATGSFVALRALAPRGA